jgi:TolB-like protein/DNA-binding winged helix-turn-helix (wHTH) protein
MPPSADRSEPTSGASSPRLAFDRFELDLRSGEMRKDGRRVRLQTQPFQMLVLLLERPGEVVTREEIRRALWQADTFVDFDHSLGSAINKIREALGDSADHPRFVETLPRRGYRFIGKLEASRGSVPPQEMPAHAEAGPSAAVDNPAVTLPENQVRSRPSGKRMTVLAIALMVAIALIVGLSLSSVRERLGLHRNTPRIQSIAVLPLVNLSNDADQDYFTDGMTEELTTALGKISALRVISRTSAMQYKGTKKSLPEIARELKVDALIEGTVSRSGNHLRITASLVEPFPEKHVWAESYESQVGDALTVQGEISQAVARKIQVQLTQQEKNLLAATPPVNPEAQDLYLRGLYTFHGGGKAESEKAASYFQRTLEKDPNYAAAYAGLAQVYSTWIPGMPRPRDLMPKAKEFARKALSLDENSADAHSVLGSIELFYDWDWIASEAEFKRTMELNPSQAWARQWHSRGLVTSGRTQEAIAEAQRSLELDPSPFDWDYPVWVFILARRYDLAVQRAQKLIDFAPDYVWGHFELVRIYEQTGRFEEAAQESLKSDELFRTDPVKVAELREVLAKSGAHGYWRQTLQNYEEATKSSYVPSVIVAQACVRVADKECAFHWLEKGFEERDDLMIDLAVEPIFDGVRSDFRFRDLVRRVGLTQ